MSDYPNDPLWAQGGSAPPANWYPDPSGSGGQRYWDGANWTDHVQPPAAPAPMYAPAHITQGSAKSPLLAIVLSVLWVGTGHFYAGRSDAVPIVLVCVNLFLIFLTVFCLVGILAWIPLVIWAAIDARATAIAWNDRHGLVTPT